MTKTEGKYSGQNFETFHDVVVDGNADDQHVKYIDLFFPFMVKKNKPQILVFTNCALEALVADAVPVYLDLYIFTSSKYKCFNKTPFRAVTSKNIY